MNQVLNAVKLLAQQARTPTELVGLLGASRRTVERILHGLEAAGYTLERKADGIYVYYSLSREVLRKQLGV